MSARKGIDAVAWFGRQSFVGGLAGEPGPGPAAPPLSVEPLDLHPSTCACPRCELDAAAVRRVIARHAGPPPALPSADTEPAAAIPANLAPHIEDVAAREQQRGRELACVRFVETIAELGRVAAILEGDPATIDDPRVEEAWQFRHELCARLTARVLEGHEAESAAVLIQREIPWERAQAFVHANRGLR